MGCMARVCGVPGALRPYVVGVGLVGPAITAVARMSRPEGVPPLGVNVSTSDSRFGSGSPPPPPLRSVMPCSGAKIVC